MASTRAIIAPPSRGNGGGGRRWPYDPPCPQYRFYGQGFIERTPDGGLTGNCSPNRPGVRNDFLCWPGPRGNLICQGSNNRWGNSPNDICCPRRTPGPRPEPRPSPCCDAATLNDCALCLDALQGDSSAANHEHNMLTTCRQCGRF